jgi:MOSC domain-containing protein YiiM
MPGPTNPANPGRVLCVNVGRPRAIEWLGKVESTSIWKSPVDGRVKARGVNLEGDDQADRSVHGGPDKAVYTYAREDQEWWQAQLGRPLEPGIFGENLTLVGLDVTGAVVGERWEIGSALFEVAQPRSPCWKLGARMGDPGFPKQFAAGGRPGAYLRIVREGDVGAGDEVRIVYRPAHGITVGEVAHIYHADRSRAGLLLEVPELADVWREWARNRIRHSERGKR